MKKPNGVHKKPPSKSVKKPVKKREGARIVQNPSHPQQTVAPPCPKKAAGTTKSVTQDEQKSICEDSHCKVCIFKVFCNLSYHTWSWCKTLATDFSRYNEEMMTIIRFVVLFSDYLRRPLL